MRSLDDTIAAVATPPGEGGVAIVRASGPGAAALARAVLRGRDGAAPRLEGRTLRWVQAVEPETGRLVDEALCLWMPGPDSYTREDVLEVQCHGAGPSVHAKREGAECHHFETRGGPEGFAASPAVGSWLPPPSA